MSRLRMLPPANYQDVTIQDIKVLGKLPLPNIKILMINDKISRMLPPAKMPVPCGHLTVTLDFGTMTPGGILVG